MKIVVFDPAVENVNAGDEIISSAVQGLPHLHQGDVERLTTHRLLRKSERDLVSQADLLVLSGTNAISSRMEKFGQWLIDPDLARRMRNKLMLLGVGWWQYQGPPNLYTRNLLNFILTDQVPHSTRDLYTHDRISALGKKSIMTGCPTMWSLPWDCQRPLIGSGRAVITVTDYKRMDPDIDRRWISVVKERYSEVDIVGMGPGDKSHFEGLGIDGVTWKGQGTVDLEAALQDAEFIGTRLHAGVKALQNGRPTLILAVDNRAKEISKSTGLHVADRADTLAIHRSVTGETVPPALTMNQESIQLWKSQYEEYVSR